MPKQNRPRNTTAARPPTQKLTPEETALALRVPTIDGLPANFRPGLFRSLASGVANPELETKYSEERGEAMAAVYAFDQRSLVKLCEQEVDLFPCLATVYVWLKRHDEFQDVWNIARRIRAAKDIDRAEEEISKDLLEGDKGDGARVSLARLRYQHRQFLAQRHAPEDWQPAQRIEGGDKPILHEHGHVVRMPARASSAEEWEREEAG